MNSPTSTVGILNLGISNIASLAKAVARTGHVSQILGSSSEIRGFTHLILPGVGSFAHASRVIREKGFDCGIRRHVQEGKPVLGICLGMQILASLGEEHGPSPGLGLIDGTVALIQTGANPLRLPHVGWNDVDFLTPSPLFKGVESGESFYFVHSYAYSNPDSNVVVATTEYGGRQVAAVQKETVFGVQFHPEKSQAVGARVLSNFLRL